MPPFVDRNDAGQQLAQLLAAFRGDDVVVLGLPGNGVRVAHGIAVRLRVRVDVVLIRPLTVTRPTEMTYGILGEDGARIIDSTAIAHCAVHATELADAELDHAESLRSSAIACRGERARVDLYGRTVVITDDGLTDMRAIRDACMVATQLGAIRVVIAVPVASHQTLGALRTYADKVVCPNPTPSAPVAENWYQRIDATTESDIACLLNTKPEPAQGCSEVSG
ncbi:phosphoribosyltransferase family protein [Nocardia jejuensis]|uniref:phosphoribosyltransferase family protein n=1 Tax=Nocardia jejuensis TaxID=328049 RepID=UPI00082DAE73|nr:phosphoribosyltransferase family protein [Nocardia jejuensis]